MCYIKFTVLEHISSYAYRFDTFPGIDNVFHTWLLQSAADNLFLSQHRADWQSSALITNNDRKEYKIEAILNEHVVNYGQDCYHKY